MEKQFARPIYFHEADPAQIMFFGKAPQIYHDLLETWLTGELGWKEVFGNANLIFPVRRLEIDYFRPLGVGQVYIWQLSVNKVSESSVTIRAEVFSTIDGINADKQTPAHLVLNCIHVAADPATGKKTILPEPWKACFQKMQS